MFFNATNNGISPRVGFTQLLEGSSVQINYAEGAKLWSNDQSGFAEAVAAAQAEAAKQNGASPTEKKVVMSSPFEPRVSVSSVMRARISIQNPFKKD